MNAFLVPRVNHNEKNAEVVIWFSLEDAKKPSQKRTITKNVAKLIISYYGRELKIFEKKKQKDNKKIL